MMLVLICRQALNDSKGGALESFSSTTVSSLISFLSLYGCRERPSPKNITKIFLQLSCFEFQLKVAPAISAIRAGIPLQHECFWNKMSCADLYSIYMASTVSVDKLVEMIDKCYTKNPAEERVLNYFRQYIGNIPHLNLVRLLRFVTGSCVLTAEGFNITFNGVNDGSRRPIVHACSSTLELSRCYCTYNEFAEELDRILMLKDFHLYQLDTF
jgi:hypothetical protein